MALPLMQSCMSYDDELMADADGMAALSVRGFVYEGADSDPMLSAAGGAAISITIFDREDSGCTVPLAKAETLTSSDGYYEARLQLRPDGDVIILVQATMPDGNGPAVEAKSVYAWRSGLYDSGIDAYCANMAPIYISRAPLH